MQKIALVGRVANDQDYFDGQTIKTRNMERLLSEIYGDGSVQVVDTVDWKNRAPFIMAALLRAARQCDAIVLMVSGNGRRALYPIMSLITKTFNIPVFQNLIGGSLANEVKKHPKWVQYLTSFAINWVESEQLVEELRELSINNAELLPNFKYFVNRLAVQKTIVASGWNFCTFSRVRKDKGINVAIEAIEELNKSAGQGEGPYNLDIYGQIDDDYKDEFQFHLDKSAHVKYLGVVDPEKSVNVIASYDALLFPTSCPWEGMPGTIIDALAAGTPVLAARWQFYDEMLEDGVTGYSYPFSKDESLVELIREYTSKSDSERFSLRENCIEQWKKYDPKKIAQMVYGRMREFV